MQEFEFVDDETGVKETEPIKKEVKEYTVDINPADFKTDITNPYFSAPVGMKMVYEARSPDSVERIEILIPGWTKEVMGVETLVFWDRVYVDGELIEDTRDYIAQDKEGNVWYFGENVDNYEGGVLVDHHGMWIGGEDGALPGYWMLASPKPGDEYRQEYYEGEAEDMGRVEETGVTVTTPAGTFNDCVKVYEWTLLEPVTAYKYHCSDVGGTALEEEDDERVELIEVDMDGAIGVALPSRYAAEGVVAPEGAPEIDASEEEPVVDVQARITEDEAKAIALKEVPGKVMDAGIETYQGKLAYVIEVDADNGPETDVFIDKDSGEVLGTEN